MDVEDANKFINALVKNLQVLCHGHVNFNNSIQVIGHLYLNVDSDTNIDYIVNEKVCKNDSSSTVFVSKSYHSEPKNTSKATASSDKRTENIEQNVVPEQQISRPISNRKHTAQRTTSKSIHPAYRDERSSFETPAKMPRLSLGEFKGAKTSTPIQSRQKIQQEVDLCIVKQEPGIEKEKDEDLQSADYSNIPGPSDGYNQNESNFLHDNDSVDMKLDTVFAQSLDTSRTASPSQFGSIDASSIDNNLKNENGRTRKQIKAALRSRRYRERKRARLEGRIYQEEKATLNKDGKDPEVKNNLSTSREKTDGKQPSTPNSEARGLVSKNNQSKSTPIQTVQKSPVITDEKQSSTQKDRSSSVGNKANPNQSYETVVKKLSVEIDGKQTSTPKSEEKGSSFGSKANPNQSALTVVKKSPVKTIQSESGEKINTKETVVMTVKDTSQKQVTDSPFKIIQPKATVKMRPKPSPILNVKNLPVKIDQSKSKEKDGPKPSSKMAVIGSPVKDNQPMSLTKAIPMQTRAKRGKDQSAKDNMSESEEKRITRRSASLKVKEFPTEMDQSKSIEKASGKKVKVKGSPRNKQTVLKETNEPTQSSQKLVKETKLEVKDLPADSDQCEINTQSSKRQLKKRRTKNDSPNLEVKDLPAESDQYERNTSSKKQRKETSSKDDLPNLDVKDLPVEDDQCKLKEAKDLTQSSKMDVAESGSKEENDTTQSSKTEIEESSLNVDQFQLKEMKIGDKPVKKSPENSDPALSSIIEMDDTTVQNDIFQSQDKSDLMQAFLLEMEDTPVKDDPSQSSDSSDPVVSSRIEMNDTTLKDNLSEEPQSDSIPSSLKAVKDTAVKDDQLLDESDPMTSTMIAVKDTAVKDDQLLGKSDPMTSSLIAVKDIAVKDDQLLGKSGPMTSTMIVVKDITVKDGQSQSQEKGDLMQAFVQKMKDKTVKDNLPDTQSGPRASTMLAVKDDQGKEDEKSDPMQAFLMMEVEDSTVKDNPPETQSDPIPPSMIAVKDIAVKNDQPESLEKNDSSQSAMKIRIKIVPKPKITEESTSKDDSLKTEYEQARDIIRARNRVRQQEYRKKKKMKKSQ